MEDYGEVNETQVDFRTLKIALVALAFLGLFIVLVGLVSNNASAVPVPAIAGSMTISTDTVWDSGTASWYGSLAVQSPATLTIKNVTVTATYMNFNVANGAKLYMNNVTITMSSYSYWYFYGIANLVDSKITVTSYTYFYCYNPSVVTLLNTKFTEQNSYMYFYANDYSKLNIKGSSIIQPNSMSIYMFFYGYSTVRIDSSYLKNVYYLYIYGYDVQVTNSSIVGGYYGAYIYSYGSANWGSEGPIFRNNLITGAYYPVYAYMWGAPGGKPVFEGNLFIQNQYYVYIYGGGNLKFNNNTVIRNNNYGIYMYQPSSLEFKGNVVQNNGGVGIYLYYLSSETAIYNNIITQNANSDMYLYSSKIRSVNNAIGKVQCQQNGELNVYWMLDVYVEWEDGSGPVADADIEFLDSVGAGVISPSVSGADGWIRDIEVLEYRWNDKGQQMYSPYTINATKYEIKAQTVVTVNKNSQAKLTLDNVPPILEIEAPVDKMLTNKNLVLVRGFTEPGATCTVNTNEVTVQPSGWFEYTINYTTEGTHSIKVVCKDASKNSRDASRTVITDTKRPSVVITSPTEGYLTKDIAVEVVGETEPGATAEVDGRTVVVDSNGIFSRLTVLEEGDNQIFVKVWDKAGNMNEANVSLKLDTIPPNLVILEPADRASFSSQDIKVVGFIEEGSILKINGMDVRYQGSSFQYSVRLTDGDNSLTIEAWDRAGNYNSKILTVSLDRKPATITILTPTENMFTNQKMVLVSGMTDPTSTVTISGDSVLVDASTGYFEKSMVLKGGANKFSVVATNKYGNSISKSVTVVQDLDAPDLTILTPDNGTVTNQETIRIEGITELGSSLTVNGKDTSVDKGKFSTYVQLVEGVNEVMVIARDTALNARSAKVFIIKDSTVDLRVATPYDGMYTTDSIINISGSTEAGTLVYINTNLKASMDMEGGFRAQLALELGTNDITISATDSLGNTKTITMVVMREEPAVVPPPTRTNQGATSTASPMWLAAALFLGLVIGGVIMGGIYVSTRRNLEENTREQIEELLTKRFEEKKAEEARIEAARAAGPQLVPRGYKGPPIHVEKPAPAMRPSTMPPGPPPVAQSRNLAAVQGEAMAPSEETVMDIDPELAATEGRVRDAEARGVDTSKARNSLKLAKFFMSKGDKEKMGKYIQKTKEVLDEIGA